jgi:hypothetical protein
VVSGESNISRFNGFLRVAQDVAGLASRHGAAAPACLEWVHGENARESGWVL